MKVRVEKTFIDKYTKMLQEAGSIIEVEEDRGKELLADPRKVVSKVEEEPKKAPVKKAASKKKTEKK